MPKMATAQEEGKQVVRVDEHSENDLQALFDTVLKPDARGPPQVPWCMRKLPDSFFRPPSTGSKSGNHSRENSTDSAVGSSQGVASVTPLPIHQRAHSSPATLQQTYSISTATGGGGTGGHQPRTNPPPRHSKQRSYEVATKNRDKVPLPPGWEQARTAEGQIYYMNHITRTTTWEDPRKTLAAQLGAHHNAELLPSCQTQNQTKRSCDADIGPLPEGWEQSQTQDGEIYYINHQTRTTTWFDPRILPRPQPGWPSATPTSQAGSQQLRLHLLQLEREKLKQRQQEIRRQQEWRGLSTNADPFLPSLSDHSRQESTDSGLGLGGSFLIPQSLEDLLGNNSAMDTSDDLASSLQLGEEFPNVNLEDVQSIINTPTTKPDNVLTWL